MGNSSTRNAFAIGRNDHGEFGICHGHSRDKLEQLDKTKHIENIYSGRHYTIYSYQNGKNNAKNQYFAAGHNSDGELGLNHTKTVNKLSQIKYFNKNNIIIKKVCVNVNSSTTFWICQNDKVYGNGDNYCGQLGISHTKHITTPILIDNLCYDKMYHITDIQSSEFRSIALCTINHEILAIICKLWISQNITNDIIVIIIRYYDSNANKIYITGNSCEYKWNELDIFNDKNIIKIQIGFRHALFLECNGNIWGFGDNSSQQLIGDMNIKQIKIPTMLNYKIKIKDIKSGYQHNLAIDYNNKAYSWGNNLRGQCGNDCQNVNYYYDDKLIYGPQLIGNLKEFNIIEIECGYEHSYCKTECDKHYLFGSNIYYECIKYDNRSPVKLPFCINHVIKQISDGKSIKSVSLGYNNTKIILW